MASAGQKQIARKLNWTNDKITELIELVEERGAIWNVKSKEYSDKDKRRDAVNSICDLLEITEDEFKRKWNTLRTQFSQERSKMEKSRKSGAGTDEVYICKWTWYEKLKFLMDVVAPKKSVSNLPSFLDQDESIESEEDDLNEDNVSVASSIDAGQDTPIGHAQKPKKLKFTPKRGKSSVAEEELKMLKSATGFLESIKNNKCGIEDAKFDEYDTFGRYVATELRQVSNPQLFRLAKHKISNIIFEAQSGMLQPQNPSASQPPAMISQWQSQSSFLGNLTSFTEESNTLQPL